MKKYNKIIFFVFLFVWSTAIPMTPAKTRTDEALEDIANRVRFYTRMQNINGIVNSGTQIGGVLLTPWINLLEKKAEQKFLTPNFVAETIVPNKTQKPKAHIVDPRNKNVLDQICNHGKLVQSPAGKQLNLTHSNILLMGDPGTGKTEFAKQLGHLLNTPVSIINGAELAGKYSDPLSVRVFLEKTKGIIYINEADFLLNERSLATPEQLAIFTTVLSALNTPNNEKIFIVDTNTTKQLDSGMIRRFPTQVIFKKPTEEMREQIIQLYVDKQLKPLAGDKSPFGPELAAQFEASLNENFSSYNIQLLAKQTDGACGAHLENFVKSVQSKTLTNNGVLTNEMIKESLHETQEIIKRSK